ncbi:MAG: hypothetical protein AAGB06_05500, partial [Verrucomicrobiota bacterium]
PGLSKNSLFNPEERPKEELLETQFIAMHTEFVGKLIIAPFAVLLLIFVITDNYFDYTFLPPTVYFLIFVLLLIALLLATQLRSVAEKARSTSIENLRKLQQEVEDAGSPNEGIINVTVTDNGEGAFKIQSVDPQASVRQSEKARFAESIKQAIEDIQGQTKGAFSSFSQNPIVYAILLPFGGAGSLVFLEGLFRYFA